MEKKEQMEKGWGLATGFTFGAIVGILITAMLVYHLDMTFNAVYAVPITAVIFGIIGEILWRKNI